MPKKNHPHAVHWFRRDLRISDNHALFRAASEAEHVIPLYLVSDWKKSHLWTGPARQQFLCDCLASLAKNLETIDGKLIVKHGDPLDFFPKFLKSQKIDALYLNQDPDPYGKIIEAKLKKICADLGVTFFPCHDVSLHAPNEVLKKDGNPYRVYTPYSKVWLGLDKTKPFPKPKSLNTPADLESGDLPTLKTWNLPHAPDALQPAGERAAHDQLKEFLENGLPKYAQYRDFPKLPANSKLSPHLRHGTISVRSILAEVQKAGSSAGSEKFIKELAWREFYFAILDKFPDVLELEFNDDWCGLPWDEPDEKAVAFYQGKTGFPFVDAGIREMRATGTMHNRLRMVVAMFFTKDLRYDWRLGEQFFMQHLIDGEIASNNGGWQWSAGTGADAAPYFRIQNPWTQGKRFDANGDYIKRWIPELKDVDAKKLHEPPAEGKPLAKGYPAPILDHAKERQKTLAIFKAHREKGK